MAGLLDQFYGPLGRNPRDNITNLLNYEATIANRGTGPLSGWYKTHVVPDIEGDDISEYESAASFGVPKPLYDIFSDVAKGGAALQGQLPAEPALMTNAAISSSMGGSAASLAGGPEGAALGANRLGRFSDWKWKPAKKVREELGLTEVPGHVQKFGNFMQRQTDKAKAGKMTPRDLIKAFTITRSSIQRGAVPAAKVRAAGLNIPGDGKIRPEGAFSEWLLTPMGQRYLNSAEKGVVDRDAVADAVKIMAPFGRHTKDIPDALTTAATGLDPSTATKILADGNTKAWRKYAKGLKGIGPAKQGFVASLLGKGDIPTLDARQLRLHTGKSPKEAQANLARKGWGDKAVDRLTRRQQDMALTMPARLEPHRQHLTHHTVWDAVGGDKTTHADVVRAMELGANKGLLAAAPQLARTAASTRSRDDAVKLGAGRMGVSEDAFDAMARQGRVAPQIAPISPKTGKEVGFQPGYSKGLKPKVEIIDEMDAGLARNQIIRPDKTIEAEGLLGKVLVPMPGDRTSRDTVTAMMGRKIDPEVLEGGYPYMADKGGWASGESVISNYKNIFDELGGRGVGVGKVMSGTGSDYSRMSTDLMYKTYDMDGMPRATKAALKKEVNIEIDQANAAAIKKAKKEALEEGRPYEQPKIQKPFKGFDKNTKELLDKDPALRKAVMGALDKDRSRKLPGAPDAIAIRHAITDDRFRDLRRGDPDPLSGFDFMSFPAGGKVTPADHKSYSHHLGGKHLGGLSGGPVPTTTLFPDFAKEMVKEGRPLSQYNYMFDRLKPTQEVDERVVQGILDYYASLRN